MIPKDVALLSAVLVEASPVLMNLFQFYTAVTKPEFIV